MKRLIRRNGSERLGSLPPLISRLFTGRGISDPGAVDHQLRFLLPPDDMKGLPGATRILCDAITTGKRILVIGDFDADGATSCALVVHGLSSLGAREVDYLVPNRFEYGYGLTPEIVDAARRFNPDLIVTVDNGISSVRGVARAGELDIDVVITDHHLPGETLPAASAIVNPNQPGCEFPSKYLAGVGVAFYLLSAVRAQLRESGWFEQRAEPNLANYLDLVALGTIADVVPLDYNNRVLVHEGIRRIRAGRVRPGLKALIGISGARLERLVSRDLAFGVAPRLNAAGRLEDISLGIECLLCDTEERAFELARKLDELNRERREIEAGMKAQAFAEIDRAAAMTTTDAVGVCLYHEAWHQGVIGIIASRIKDRIHRPVIAFARGEGGELKGSARSIPGLHVRDALDNIAARHPGLLTKFGGHAAAAGLSLPESSLERFGAAFDEEARRWLSDDDLEQVVVTDGEIDEPLNLSLVRQIMEAAPWGQGFDEPVFDGEFEIVDQRIVGGGHLKLQVRPRHGTGTVDAIAFNVDTLIEGRYRRLAYRVDVNEYRGLESVQLIIEATEVGDATAVGR